MRTGSSPCRRAISRARGVGPDQAVRIHRVDAFVGEPPADEFGLAQTDLLQLRVDGITEGTLPARDRLLAVAHETELRNPVALR